MNTKRLLTATFGVMTLTATLTSAMAAAPSGPLVTTDWLEKNLSDPKVRVIEVSVNPGVYERGHIPGAVNFSWHTDLRVGLVIGMAVATSEPPVLRAV